MFRSLFFSFFHSLFFRRLLSSNSHSFSLSLFLLCCKSVFISCSGRNHRRMYAYVVFFFVNLHSVVVVFDNGNSSTSSSSNSSTVRLLYRLHYTNKNCNSSNRFINCEHVAFVLDLCIFVQSKVFYFPHDLWNLMVNFKCIQANNVKCLQNDYNRFMLNYLCMRQCTCMWMILLTLFFLVLPKNSIVKLRDRLETAVIHECVCVEFQRPLKFILLLVFFLSLSSFFFEMKCYILLQEKGEMEWHIVLIRITQVAVILKKQMKNERQK